LSPLAIIFLTIFVNLVGFGIIIPLLPFYAQTFGASPLAIGFLFASFSLSQLVASPILGDLSDRWGRRPVLIFSLLGTVVSFVMLALAWSLPMLFVARIVDGLSGGNITTARAYIADITIEENRARAFGLLGAAFGLGFIVGPGLGAAFSRISYTAPIWAAAIITVLATALAIFWLPETVHRTRAGGGSPWRMLPDLWKRAHLRVLFSVDFVYWTAFAVYQTTFALFGARRFGFDAAHTGYLLSAFGFLGVVVQGGMVGPAVRALGERRTLGIGLLFAAAGWGGSALTHSLPVFVGMLVPGAIGIGLCNATLSSLISKSAAPEEQGRVQGAAGALESLGRTIGPVWGNGALQRFGEGTAYGSAAAALVGAAALAMSYRQLSRPADAPQP
jgi:DHA1 family tetracycline resistance protein-like MFS transporter